MDMKVTLQAEEMENKLLSTSSQIPKEQSCKKVMKKLKIQFKLNIDQIIAMKGLPWWLQW